MYRIIIIDDEDEVREGIKLKTDWSACGFELVGDYDNGRDALELMESLQPDVIITDICMPFMDGLELAERVMNQYRDVKIVIVTGYEDFDYAKNAIKLKVKDYLLKPVNSKEFTNFLYQMKKELDQERQQTADLSHLKIQLNQSLPLLRERFLEGMATTRLKLDEINRKFTYFNLTLPGPNYIALVVDIDEIIRDTADNPETKVELLQFAAFNIVQEICENEAGGIVFRTRDNKIAVMLSGNADEISMNAQLAAEQLKHSIHKYLKLTVTVGIGRTCSDLQHVSGSFQEALSALDYRFLLGKNKIISIHDLEYGQGIDTSTYKDWEKRLLSAMKTGRCNQISQELNDWIDYLKSTNTTIELCYSSIYKFIVSLMDLLIETGIDNLKLLGEDPFSQISSKKTLDDVFHWLEQTCHRIILVLSEKRTDVSKSQMVAAEAYIRENYRNEDLSLNDVCNHIYLSTSYFSMLFKQHTGETFVEFLTRFRLGKAKELLSATAMKTYEIASRVGYSDPQYFSVIFKRHTGMTTKEYRSAMKEDQSV